MNEAEQYLRTNNLAVFEGDSLALLVSIYKNEDLPLNIRQNAAIAASPFENPKMSDARILLLETRQQQVTEEERQRQIKIGDQRLDDLQSMFEGFTADREREIEEMLALGEVTEAGAEKLRQWHLQPEQPPLPALPPPPREPPQARLPACETPRPPITTPSGKPPTGKPAPRATSDVTMPPWLDGSLDAPAPQPEPQIEDLIETIAGIDRNGKPIIRWMPRSQGGY